MIYVEIPSMDGAILSYTYLKVHEDKLMEMTNRALRNNSISTTMAVNGSFTVDSYILDDNPSTMFNIVSTSSPPAKIPTFDDVSMTKAIVYGAMFVISFVGNVATLIQMYRMRRRKSTINTLIVNLALADLLVTFFCIAGEAAWAATVQWYGGDLVCKSVKYMQVFALYLSTYITVAISLDRCIAILDPMRRNGATLRVRTMILLAWGFSALFSIPQVSFCFLLSSFRLSISPSKINEGVVVSTCVANPRGPIDKKQWGPPKSMIGFWCSFLGPRTLSTLCTRLLRPWWCHGCFSTPTPLHWRLECSLISKLLVVMNRTEQNRTITFKVIVW